MAIDYNLSVDNVYNAFMEHMTKLDELWPDSEPHGPRKVLIVELIDAIKLRLIMQAEKNSARYESPFEKAAKKITGYKEPIPRKEQVKEDSTGGKTAMQTAHEAAKARIKNSSS